MANPTWDESAGQAKAGVKCLTDLQGHLATQASDIDSLEQALEGEYLPASMEFFVTNHRARLDQAAGRDAHLSVWIGWLREVCRLIGSPETSVEGMSRAVHRYMHDNTLSFNSRGISRGSASAGGSNVGNGGIDRVTVDWEGYALQHGHVETKTWRCTRDGNARGGVRYGETFEVLGTAAARDSLTFSGSGIRVAVQARHDGFGDGRSMAGNPGFDASFAGTGFDKVPSWTIAGAVAGDVTADTSNVFRTPAGVTTAQSLAIAAGSGEIVQALSLHRIDALGDEVPWVFECRMRKSDTGATGTVTLKCGSKSQAFDLSTFSGTGWHRLRLDLDKDLYYRNWRENAPDIEIEWATTSHSINLDTVLFGPAILVDGTWWWPYSGSTAFLLDDSFTVADTGGAVADGEMMWSAFRARLPWYSFPTHGSGGETIADP